MDVFQLIDTWVLHRNHLIRWMERAKGENFMLYYLLKRHGDQSFWYSEGVSDQSWCVYNPLRSDPFSFVMYIPSYLRM